mgnify:CR=1 FL=1
MTESWPVFQALRRVTPEAAQGRGRATGAVARWCRRGAIPVRVAGRVSVCRRADPVGEIPRSRSSGGERPPHTRKVTDSSSVVSTKRKSATPIGVALFLYCSETGTISLSL